VTPASIVVRAHEAELIVRTMALSRSLVDRGIEIIVATKGRPDDISSRSLQEQFADGKSVRTSRVESFGPCALRASGQWGASVEAGRR
jgi:hypothetical protein